MFEASRFGAVRPAEFVLGDGYTVFYRIPQVKYKFYRLRFTSSHLVYYTKILTVNQVRPQFLSFLCWWYPVGTPLPKVVYEIIINEFNSVKSSSFISVSN